MDADSANQPPTEASPSEGPGGVHTRPTHASTPPRIAANRAKGSVSNCQHFAPLLHFMDTTEVNFMRFTTLGCLFLLAFAPIISAQDPPPESSLGDVVNRAPIVETPTEEVERNVVQDALEALTLEQRIGQLLLVTLNGLYRPDNTDRELFNNHPPGGVIVPAIARPIHAVQYITQLRASPMEMEHRIPLFIAANIYALTQHDIMPEDAFVQLPSMLSISAATDPKATEALAELIATHLESMGFNMHLGPSLVLAPRLPKATPSIHGFGSDPQGTAIAARPFFDAFRTHNILSVAMGFPGGGADRVGRGQGVLLTPYPLLMERDLYPYIQAIEQGVSFIHVNNTLVPTIDKSTQPASFSPLVILDLLRKQLGFDGIVIAGPVDGSSISDRYGPAEAAISSLNAGADMLYLRGSGKSAARVVRGVADAVRDGRMSEALINAALHRVLSVKVEMGLIDRPLPESKEAQKLEDQKDKYQETYRIERRSITLIQNRGAVLPLDKNRSSPVGITGIIGAEELHGYLEPYLKRIALQPIGNASHAGRIQDFEIDRLTLRARGMRTAICVFDNSVAPEGQVRLIEAFRSQNVRVVVVLLGFPKHVEKLRVADAIVLAYSSSASVDQSLRAVADILVGKAPVLVLPPQRELHRAAKKSIEFNALDVILSPTGRLPTDVSGTLKAGYSVPYNPVLSLDNVEWTFGDGKRSRRPRDTHAYDAPGRYTVTLTVTDTEGDASTGSFTVVVE